MARQFASVLSFPAVISAVLNGHVPSNEPYRTIRNGRLFGRLASSRFGGHFADQLVGPVRLPGGIHVVPVLGPSLKQRVERSMSIAIIREMQILERGMTFLATTGSTATFIGLFGTVWGIMNSFTAIASMNNTSLAVVAPGIAEALFATAAGLVAAIPAMVAYNVFSSRLARYADRLHAFATEFSAIMSRHLDSSDRGAARKVA